MRCLAVLAAIAILAACGDGAARREQGEVSATMGHPDPSSRRDEIASLGGEWRVAGIDGQALDQPVGIALSGDEQELWWEPRCAGVVRSYRLDGTGIAFGPPVGVAPLPPGSPPPPVCAIGLPPRLDAVARALDTAKFARRTPENGILLSGGGHSVLLFTQ